MRGRPVDRLMAKVEKVGECWIWTGATNSTTEYGRFWLEGQVIEAHRAAFILLVGPIPEGHFVLHRCDTPPCVNPAHLFTGTQSDNMRDAQEKGRLVVPEPRRPEACHRGHVLDEANTYRRPSGRRECRRCKNDRQRADRGVTHAR